MSPDSSICFLGDFACPHALVEKLERWSVPEAGFVVVNLEGAVQSEACSRQSSGGGHRLYNSADAISVLQRWNVKLASLANNHLLDVNPRPSETRGRLQSVGIGSCGGGDTLDQASAPFIARIGDQEVVFLAFGWRSIGCRPATATSAGVNPLTDRHVIDSVEHYRSTSPDAKLVVMLHWDYELEIYPLPAQRKLAFDAIDAGADIIVGHHPHCVQGIETYRDRPIIYSLGNWLIPHGDWFGAPLAYPEFANLQLAVRWDLETGKLDRHYFTFCPDTMELRPHPQNDLPSGATSAEQVPFAGMEQTEYIAWFRRHRRQKKLLPVFTDFGPGLKYRSMETWVSLRHMLVQARAWVRHRAPRMGRAT